MEATNEADVTLYGIEDCETKMLYDWEHGKQKGTTTYIPAIDDCWTWRPQEFNIWSGYSNEGKSLKIKQLSMIKALMEEKKFIFCAPEDYPPDEWYDDMIHTLTGFTTDKDSHYQVSLHKYKQAVQLLKESFFFLYVKPPDNPISRVLDQFRRIADKKDVFGFVVDPLLKFQRPAGMDRDDQYASYIGSLSVDFCRDTNTSLHMVMHQLTPKVEMESKLYPEPSMYTMKGGGSWADGADNVLTVWRKFYAKDKLDPTVQFASQKIKRQKLVGIPQRLQMKFDRRSNRYTSYADEKPLFDFDSIFKKSSPIIFSK